MNKNLNFLFFIACLVCLSSNASADTTVPIHDCTFSADSLFSTGEVVTGTGSEIAGVELVDWIHDTPGYTFETVGDPGIVGDPDGIECRLNGVISANIVSEGTAMIDGTPGFSYIIDIEDNRPPESVDQIRLCSTLVQSPRTQNVGSSVFDPLKLAVIPEFIPVNLGEAGRGKVRLQLDKIKCSYRGTGTPGEDYIFERCAGPGGHELMPLDSLMVSEVSLRIQSADRSAPVTSVQVELGTDTAFRGVSDFYFINIFNPDATVFDSSGFVVACGDIVIDLIH